MKIQPTIVPTFECPHFLCVLVVWGNYTSVFLETSLPTQLSPENLPCLTNASYHIYTSEQDAAIIKHHHNFIYLQKYMPVELHLIKIINSNRYVTMSESHRKAIICANSSNSALIFLTPDVVLAEGTLKRVQQLAMKGVRVISTVGLRLKSESVRPLLNRYLNKDKHFIQISTRELMKMALDNLHNITLKHIWGGHEEMICNNLFWRISNEGLVGRCFHLHPLMVYPRNRSAKFFSTIDYDYPANACPDFNDHYIVSDSDEICICELTTETREMRGVKNTCLNKLTLFSELYVRDAHLNNIRTPIRMHSGTLTESEWIKSINESQTVVNYIASSLEQNAYKLLFRHPKLFVARLIRQGEEAKTSNHLTFFNKQKAIMTVKLFQILFKMYSACLWRVIALFRQIKKQFIINFRRS